MLRLLIRTAFSMSRKPNVPLRVAIYSRVSTDHQTTENQERELQGIADRVGWVVVKVYRDHGVSGAKLRHDRPAFDALCKDASRRRFDLIAAWSVDRLGRSLQDLVSFLTEIHAFGILSGPLRRNLALRRMTNKTV